MTSESRPCGQVPGLPFEAIFRASPLAASVSSERDGRIVDVNDAWLRITGLTREAVVGRTTQELGQWPDEAARQRFLDEVRQGRSESHQQICVIHGQPSHVQLHASLVDAQPDRLLLVFLTVVTREHLAEQALHESNLKLQQQVELYAAMEKMAHVGHWTNAVDEQEVIWSDGLYALAGLDPSPSLSRGEGRGGIHADDLPGWMAAREAMDGRVVEFRWMRPDGRSVWLRSRMGRTAVAGNPQTDFGIVQDITAEKEAAQALSAQLAFLQNIAARVPGVLFEASVRPDGSSLFSYMSDRALDMLELDPQELARNGNRFFERVHAEDKKNLIVTLTRSAELLVPWRSLFRAVLPKKGLRWYAVDAQPQREADGSTLWYGFCNDVTITRLAQENLSRQHSLLNAVQKAQSAFIESDDKRTSFVDLLDALLSVTGSRFGFVGEVLFDMREQPYLKTHAISNVAWDVASRKAYADHRESGMEFRTLDTLFGHALVTREVVISNDPAEDPRAKGTPAGHPRLTAFLGIPLMVGNRLVAMVGLANRPGGYSQDTFDELQPLLGAVRQLVMAWRGHQERRRARLQFQATSALLAEKSTALQQTFDSISQGIVQMDALGRVLFYNRRVLEMLDLPESWMESQPCMQDILHFQATRGDFGENFELVDPVARDYLAGLPGALPPQRYLRHTVDGRVLEIHTRMLPEGGQVRTYTDVSSYVQAQEQVHSLNATLERRVAERTAELERSMKDMEVISYSIAHDLRAPLRSVNGFTALIEEEGMDQLSPVSRDMFARILRSSSNMGQMITDMLELLRVVRVPFEPEPVDMDALVHRVLDSLGPDLARAQISCSRLPQVEGDATLLRQLLSNLLDNALKYARHRETPRIAVGFDSDQGAFYVRDNGMGFDMARANKLFGLFQRLHAGSGVPGTGVGLAIVARIVERHGGRIWAESRPDDGATFWWTLPTL